MVISKFEYATHATIKKIERVPVDTTLSLEGLVTRSDLQESHGLCETADFSMVADRLIGELAFSSICLDSDVSVRRE